MVEEKPGDVWVSARLRAWGRVGKPALLAASLWLLTTSAAAQPLQSGIQGADGRRFVLDDSSIRVVGKDFAVGPELDDEGVSALFQGSQSWGDSFLALTEAGLLRISSKDSSGGSKLIVSGESLKVIRWGESFLVYAEQGKELWVVSSSDEKKLSLVGALSALEILNPTLAVVRTDLSLYTLRQEAGPNLAEAPVPFPIGEAKISLGAGRAVAWSPKSAEFVDLSTGRSTRLPEAPSLGLRVLDDGSVISAGLSWLTVSPASKPQQRFPLPASTTEALFSGWQLFMSGKELQQLSSEEGQAQARRYSLAGPVKSASLGEGKIRSVIFPETGQPGQPLLFMETSFEEPKIDEDGKAVYDLATDKEMMLTVTGHKLFALQPDGVWKQLVDEPRSGLVGPLERIGDRVVYATQTEPVHRPGQELELDDRYPYPAVILHGRSLSKPEDVWAYDKPRGETPFKGRVPEAAWPLLGETGPLLITSEEGTLLAIDPATGSLQWSSPKLPMDDSSPLMLSWDDGLGLVAAKSTGRALLVLDPKTGQLRDTVTLNDIFFWEKWRHLLGLLTVCAALAYYIYWAGKKTLYIRQIAGLKALDEAVGRATEMGKPVLYVVGLADVDDIQTMASLSILSHVARKTAEYDTPIITTTARAVVFSTAHEIVRDAFSIAGRPDAFSSESVRYISDDQFGYTAGVDGIMVREKPAANFYIGNFYAESLILAETGFATGAIQIAGTAQPSQVPFFVAACDYTLIGEELYAASAYLSRDPLQVGSLRGQDVGKMIVMILLVVCSILVSFGIDMKVVGDWLGVALV